MEIVDWMKAHEELFTALGILSVVLFLVSLLIFPLIIIFLPHNYFIRSETPIAKLPPFRILLRILKNAFGVLMLIAGLLMLFLPGQGLLAIFLGLSLVHFPGKRRLEVRLLKVSRVRRSIEWVRRKAKRPPLQIPV